MRMIYYHNCIFLWALNNQRKQKFQNSTLIMKQSKHLKKTKQNKKVNLGPTIEEISGHIK